MYFFKLKEIFNDLSIQYQILNKLIEDSDLPVICERGDAVEAQISSLQERLVIPRDRLFIPANDGLERRMAIRYLASRTLTSMAETGSYPRGLQCVICVPSIAESVVEKINSLKEEFKFTVQQLKTDEKGDVKRASQAIKEFTRDVEVGFILKRLGIANFSLQMIYRHFYCFGKEESIDGITFSWSRAGNATKVLKYKEVISSIMESEYSPEDKSYFIGKTQLTANPAVEFFKSRTLSTHQIFNVRKKGRKNWIMHRSSLPVMVVSDHLPDVVFNAKPSDNSHTARMTRRDSTVKSAVLFVPRLGIYMRESVSTKQKR